MVAPSLGLFVNIDRRHKLLNIFCKRKRELCSVKGNVVGSFFGKEVVGSEKRGCLGKLEGGCSCTSNIEEAIKLKISLGGYVCMERD